LDGRLTCCRPLSPEVRDIISGDFPGSTSLSTVVPQLQRTARGSAGSFCLGKQAEPEWALMADVTGETWELGLAVSLFERLLQQGQFTLKFRMLTPSQVAAEVDRTCQQLHPGMAYSAFRNLIVDLRVVPRFVTLPTTCPSCRCTLNVGLLDPMVLRVFGRCRECDVSLLVTICWSPTGPDRPNEVSAEVTSCVKSACPLGVSEPVDTLAHRLLRVTLPVAYAAR